MKPEISWDGLKGAMLVPVKITITLSTRAGIIRFLDPFWSVSETHEIHVVCGIHIQFAYFSQMVCRATRTEEGQWK